MFCQLRVKVEWTTNTVNKAVEMHHILYIETVFFYKFFFSVFVKMKKIATKQKELFKLM